MSPFNLNCNWVCRIIPEISNEWQFSFGGIKKDYMQSISACELQLIKKLNNCLKLLFNSVLKLNWIISDRFLTICPKSIVLWMEKLSSCMKLPHKKQQHMLGIQCYVSSYTWRTKDLLQTKQKKENLKRKEGELWRKGIRKGGSQVLNCLSAQVKSCKSHVTNLSYTSLR